MELIFPEKIKIIYDQLWTFGNQAHLSNVYWAPDIYVRHRLRLWCHNGENRHGLCFWEVKWVLKPCELVLCILLFLWRNLQMNCSLCILHLYQPGTDGPAWKNPSASTGGEQTLAMHQVRIWDVVASLQTDLLPREVTNNDTRQNQSATCRTMQGMEEMGFPTLSSSGVIFTTPPPPFSSALLPPTLTGKQWLTEGTIWHGLWSSSFYNLFCGKENLLAASKKKK